MYIIVKIFVRVIRIRINRVRINVRGYTVAISIVSYGKVCDSIE